MYIQEVLSEDVKICFTQETMSKSTRMIQLEYENNSIELYCTIEQAKRLANQLLESVIIFENKWTKGRDTNE